jgi:hypothetical protein
MKRFDAVREILEKAVNGKTIGAHGNFWRGIDLPTFIAKSVFGRKLVEPGKGAESNLVKALRGQAPFGRDLTPRPPGAIFPRMPLRLPPVDDAGIAFIEAWINDGCPDEEVKTTAPMAAMAAAAADPQAINRFYREFDSFFLRPKTPETTQHLNAYMEQAFAWPGFSQDSTEAGWTSVLQQAPMTAAIAHLSSHQLRIIKDHFGAALDTSRLSEAYWLFGRGDLPDDPLRPGSPKHRMDGATMWLMWLSFADAAIRTGESARDWEGVSKAIALGVVGDALFRTDRPASDRLNITRYKATDPNLKDKVVSDFAGLSGKDLLSQNIGLGLEAQEVPTG